VPREYNSNNDNLASGGIMLITKFDITLPDYSILVLPSPVFGESRSSNLKLIVKETMSGDLGTWALGSISTKTVGAGTTYIFRWESIHKTTIDLFITSMMAFDNETMTIDYR
jgi:hypothetical protein